MRIVLVLLLMIGLVLPRTGAALAELAGLETAVICRGDALVTVTLGADGRPVELAEDGHGPCLAAPPPPLPFAPAAHRDAARAAEPAPMTPRVAWTALWDGRPPGQGPPAA